MTVDFPDIPDREFYGAVFSPWFGYGDFAGPLRAAVGKTIVSQDRLYILHSFVRHTAHIPGDLWECGVYQGGSAAVIAASMRPGKRLVLFDTFTGLPGVDEALDRHAEGDFADTSVAAVRDAVGGHDFVDCVPGLIPETFKGRRDAVISFAHIDVDLYGSVWACCEFIYPRLSLGGVMVFDDYGFKDCPGARAAVDRYFGQIGVVPIVLPTGQALVIKA